MEDAKDNSIHFLVRTAFWVVGAVTGGILAYTTRFYFTFGDALCYAERGENLFRASGLQ